MFEKYFYKYGFLEVAARRLLYKFPNIKNKIKRVNRTEEKSDRIKDFKSWKEYTDIVNSSVENDSILLVHASMDGLKKIGVDEEEVIKLLQSLVKRGCTVVCTAFPITAGKIIKHETKTYDPVLTPCGSGMLSNRFICEPQVVRSIIPYNTLAALGPRANEMMGDNYLAEYVYGEHTPWKYCVDHHARILFIGTSCAESNTIQTHMLADYMMDRWPIDNWYEVYDCPVRINKEVVMKKLYIQRVFWTQFLMDYFTTSKIEKKGLLNKYNVKGCLFEYITDSYKMVKYLESECMDGNLMYMIPKKYWKKQ